MAQRISARGRPRKGCHHTMLVVFPWWCLIASWATTTGRRWCHALSASLPPQPKKKSGVWQPPAAADSLLARRVLLDRALVATVAGAATGISAPGWGVGGRSPTIAAAAAAAAPNNKDCYSDCRKNCDIIAPKNPDYCQATCQEYCDQPDRTDGLSGSVSDAGGEVGILGGTFGTGTVVKGDDKPPSITLPGLDFTTEAGKKLIGY